MTGTEPVHVVASAGKKRRLSDEETAPNTEVPIKVIVKDRPVMACNQTDVSRLQELCMKCGWNPPIYDTTDTVGPANDPLFEITVTVFRLNKVTGETKKITGVGKGRQKKAAKHDAAKKALEQLQEKALPDTRVNVPPPKPPTNHDEDVSGANPIGELQTLCSTKRLPSPVYDVIGDEGEPHEKIFTYKCSVSQRSATGTASKKQIAKHKAALNMLAILKSDMKSILDEIPNDPAASSMYSQKSKDTPVPEKDKKRDLEALEKYKALKASCGGDIPAAPLINPGTKFSDYHLKYASQLIDLKKTMEKPGIKQESNPLKKLKLIVEELHFSLDTVSNIGQDKRRFIVFVHVNTDPPTIQAGQDESEIVATEVAAQNVIDFLSVMSM